MILIVVACILSRLPQLMSPHLVLDGDEAILGLMAKHFSEGKELPFYFYGQSYGFSFLEVLPISMAFMVFGVSALTVKVTMLFMFILSMLLFYGTILRFKPIDARIPLLVTMLFVLFPAWAVWSMKARGGYMSAFLLFNLYTFLAFKQRSYGFAPCYVILGVLTVTIYETQLLWFPGTVLLAIYVVITSKSISPIPWFIIGIFASFFLFEHIKKWDTRATEFWTPQVFGISDNLFKQILGFPNKVYINFTGSYSLGEVVAPGQVTSYLAVIGTLFLIFILIVAFFKIRMVSVVTDHSNTLITLLLLVLGSCASIILFSVEHFRYMLPLSGLTFLLIGFLMRNVRLSKRSMIILAIPIIMGVGASFEFRNYQVSDVDSTALDTLIEQMIEDDIKYVFTRNGLLQWQVMFYSKESITARYRTNHDRYPPYVTIVNKGFETSPDKTAIIGPYDPYFLEGISNVQVFDNVYFIAANPSRELLLRDNFELD